MGGEGNGESEGRVKQDMDGSHLDCLHPRRKCVGHFVDNGQLPEVPMSGTEPRRMEEGSIPHEYPAAMGRMEQWMTG